METRNISLTLDKAKEWYNSDNEALKEAALQAFSVDELNFDFTKIKNFTDVLMQFSPTEVLDINESAKYLDENQRALLRLSLIRKVLNKGFTMKATEGDAYFPFNPLITLDSTYYKEELENKTLKKIANILVENKEYILLGGCGHGGGRVGLLYFLSNDGVGFVGSHVGFLGCATKEIAKHMSLYFAKEIFDAKYKGWLDYKWLCKQ